MGVILHKIHLMNQKLENLIDQLVTEGVNKGEVEAQQIIVDAKSEAERILNEARISAEKIIADANEEASTLKTNTETELRLSAGQMMSAIRQEIADVICKKTIDTPIKEALSNNDFVKQLMTQALSAFSKNEEVKFYTSETEKQQMEDNFRAVVKETLSEGITLETINSIKAGFQIGAGDGSYKISFSDKDFEQLFRGFLRPKLNQLLFVEK